MQCRNDVPEAPTPTLPVLSTHHSQSISGVDTAPGYEDKNESFESILSPVRADYPTGLERGCSKPGGLGQSRSWDSYLVLTELCSSSWSWQNLTAPKEKKKKAKLPGARPQFPFFYTRGNWTPDSSSRYCTQPLTICKQALFGDPESDRYKSRRS